MTACSWEDHFGIMGKWNRVTEFVEHGVRIVLYECPKCHIQQGVPLSSRAVEMVPDEVRDQRKEYFNSTVQPWRGGEASREFIEAHPKQAAQMFTQQERAKAKDVWFDQPGYATRKRSK